VIEKEVINSIAEFHGNADDNETLKNNIQDDKSPLLNLQLCFPLKTLLQNFRKLMTDNSLYSRCDPVPFSYCTK
jgi:hypothetical protein